MRNAFLVPLVCFLFTTGLVAEDIPIEKIYSTLRVAVTHHYKGMDRRGGGSAVAVDMKEFGFDRYHVLTACHVTLFSAGDGSEPVPIQKIEVEVKTLDSAVWYEATVVYRFPGVDLAILKIGAAPPYTVPFAPNGTVKVGSECLVVGCPMGSASSPTKGWVVELDTKMSGSGAQCSASFYYGNSGGAVLNVKGELIGLVVSGRGNGSGQLAPNACCYVPEPIMRAFMFVAASAVAEAKNKPPVK